MRSFGIVLLGAGVLLIGASIIAHGSLSVFTGQQSATDNAFTSFSCDTGLLDPSAQAADTGGDGDGFEVNPVNGGNDGGGFAENNNGPGDRHRYYDYAIPLPAVCTIVSGIEVRLDWWLNTTGQDNGMSVELSWDGGASWTPAQTDPVESTSEHTAILGGPSDTWGRAWTMAELSDATFRVRITSECSGPGSSCDSHDFFLDWVAVKVSFLP